jgi:hypothetical protein
VIARSSLPTQKRESFNNPPEFLLYTFATKLIRGPFFIELKKGVDTLGGEKNLF